MNHETIIYYKGLEISVEYHMDSRGIVLQHATIVGPEINLMALDIFDQETRDTLLSELKEVLDYITQP